MPDAIDLLHAASTAPGSVEKLGPD